MAKDEVSEPYTPAQITYALRSMTDEQLASVTPRVFQMWPVRKIVAGNVINELISNERARRRNL